ncbi:hypothetical protein [uncultured Akkermansia sp.]|uniref:hypothetical protein n=1 Tax=uncultured Akkermansia sp. TaxID=512294 RepID=UPI00216E6AB1|nr:hypothetical protein [uncultured Akkermansia sp.]MCI8922267.1 hypothetical protein [Acutalibacter sp.]
MSWKKKNSTRGLLGLQGFTNYGVKTTSGELVAFLVQPTNISVLSHANVEVKIRHLLTVLSTHPSLEISCLDSCERFDDNKRFIQRRMQEEENESVRRALKQDMAFLDGIQLEMSTARQFLFLVRFAKNEKPELVFHDINLIEKNITDRGFEVRRMGKEDIKRVLGIYFESSMSGEQVEDVDGMKNFDMEKAAS